MLYQSVNPAVEKNKLPGYTVLIALLRIFGKSKSVYLLEDFRVATQCIQWPEIHNMRHRLDYFNLEMDVLFVRHGVKRGSRAAGHRGAHRRHSAGRPEPPPGGRDERKLDKAFEKQ